MGKGVLVHAEAPQYAYETKFVVDADNAKIQLTAIGNAIGFEFETTYEEKNNGISGCNGKRLCYDNWRFGIFV